MTPGQASQAQPLQDIASNIKKQGMSTAQIMRNLLRAAMEVPANVTDKDPAFKASVATDARMANARSKLQTIITDYTSHLNQLNTGIQTSLSELGKVKQALPLRDSFSQTFDPLKAKVIATEEEQAKLLHQVMEMIDEQRNSIPDLLKQLGDGKKSRADVLKALQPFMVTQDKITLSTVKLLTDAKELQVRLNDVHKLTSQAANAATGMRVPEIKPPTFGK